AIASELQPLESLAEMLNGGMPASKPGQMEVVERSNRAELIARGAAIVEATIAADRSGRTRPPAIPPAVVPLFNALAMEMTFIYQVIPEHGQPKRNPKFEIVVTASLMIRQEGRVLQGINPQAIWVPFLTAYLNSRERDRLRKCPVCGKW